MTTIDNLIVHEFPNPQSDDPPPHDHTLPSDWNNGHILNGGTDGDVLTCMPANASRGGFRTVVGSGAISVVVTATQIQISTSGSVVTGSGTSGRVPRWTGSTTLGDGVLRDDGTVLALNGAVNTFEQFALKGTWAPTGAGAAIGVSTTITAVTNASHFGIDIYPTINRAGSGTHTTFASAAFEAPTIGGGAAALTNAATVLITGAPSAATNNFGLWAQAGSFRFDSVGPHSIGGALDTNTQLIIRGSFSSAGVQVRAVLINSTLTPAVNADAYVLNMGPTINKAASGTHADFASVFITAPTINAGASTLTNATTLKLNGPPSVGDRLRTFWVLSGLSEFTGITAVSGGSGTVHAGMVGIEFRGGASPSLLAFNRGTSAYLAMVYDGLGHQFQSQGTNYLQVGFTTNSALVNLVANSWTGSGQTEMMRAQTTLQGIANANSFGLIFVPQFVEAASGTHGQLTGIYVLPTFTNGGGATTSVFGINVDAISAGTIAPTNVAALRLASPSGATNNYVILNDTTTGLIRFDAQGSVSFGGTVNDGVAFYLRGTYASGQAFARALQVDKTLTAAADGGNLVGIYLNPVFTERSGGNHALLAGMYVQPTVSAGAATVTTAAGIYIDTITWASGTTEATGITINAPTTGTTNYAILANTGGLRIAAATASALGTALDANVQLKFGGTFAGSTNSYGMQMNTSLTGTAGNNIAGMFITPTLTEAGSGTHTIEAGIYVGITITAGAGNATDAAGILIDTFAAASGTTNASGLKVVSPTGSATNTYGIWSTGPVRVDNYVHTTAPNTRTDAGNAYTVGVSDNFLIINKAATFTLTLPSAAIAGRVLLIQTYTANTVVSAASNVVPKGGGAATTAILPATGGAWAWIVSDGTNWVIMSSGT